MENEVESGPNVVNLAVQETITSTAATALAQGLTEVPHKKFKRAMKALSLHPYDPDEDESMHEEVCRNPCHFEWDSPGDEDSEDELVDRVEPIRFHKQDHSPKIGVRQERKDRAVEQIWPKLMVLGWAEATSYEPMH